MEDYDEDLLLKSDNHLVPTQTAKVDGVQLSWDIF